MKRALLIASNMHERLGIAADLECMTKVFEDYEFDCIQPLQAPATRERILEALKKLVEDSNPEDTVAIYYTGHGGLARFDGEIAGLAELTRVWRYLVPEDPDHSASQRRFAGILDVELGHIIGTELARKCPNVTLILECCYAGGMFAPPDVRLDARPRGLVEVNPFEVPEELKGPQSWSIPATEPGRTTGQAPIIVAATSEARKAYETKQDGSAADFTAALAGALRRHRGRTISWGRLIDGVRREVQVLGQRMSQAPHVIGPRGRRVFGVSTSDGSREFEVVVGDDDGLRLIAGALHGLHEDDDLELLDPRTDTALTSVRVRELETARACLAPETGLATVSHEPGTSLVAVLRASAKPAPVRLIGSSPTLLELHAELLASPWLRVCEDADEPGLFTVRVDAGRLLLEGEGLRRKPVPERPRADLTGDVESPVAWMVSDLEALARARRFVEVCERAPAPPKQIRLTLLADDEPVEHGDILRRGQIITLEMRYGERYTGETRFLNLINIGLEGRPHLINTSLHNTGGLAVFSEDPDRVLGQSRTLKWPSMRLGWPPEVPLEPKSESLYFVLSSRELDLEPLTVIDSNASHEWTPAVRGPSIVERMMAPVEVWVQRLDFTLEP